MEALQTRTTWHINKLGRIRTSLIATVSVMLLFPALGLSSDRIPDVAVLKAYQALYSISKQEAVDRIAKEAEAQRIYHALRDHLGSAWAGAWIDSGTAALVIATTDDDYVRIIHRLGAEARLVEHSRGVLALTMDQVREQRATNPQLREFILASFIDDPTNSVVLRVASGTRELVRNLLELSRQQHGQLRFEVSESIPELSALIRGANCYESDQSNQKCSIGFSVEDQFAQDGYITAAHCAMSMASIVSVSECNSSTAIGSFEESDWPNSDRAWVRTNTNYNPVPQINGYNDGILNIPSEGAGIVEAPVNSTVCRYGHKTGGPHCGQILEKDVDQTFCVRANAFGQCMEFETLAGLTKTNACIDSGDSGGPYITATGQAQGTLVGGLNGTCDPGYSEPKKSWFQPVLPTISLYSLAILTTHGANAPEISGFTCPHTGSSGSGTYVCWIDHFDAQGITSQNWSTNTGDSSQSSLLFGTCSSTQTVYVTLTVSSPYGSDQSQASFPCPTYPIR